MVSNFRALIIPEIGYECSGLVVGTGGIICIFVVFCTHRELKMKEISGVNFHSIFMLFSLKKRVLLSRDMSVNNSSFLEY